MAIIIWLCSSTHLLNYLCDWAAMNKQCNESTLYGMLLHTRSAFHLYIDIYSKGSHPQPSKSSHCTFHAHFLSIDKGKDRERVVCIDFYLPHLLTCIKFVTLDISTIGRGNFGIFRHTIAFGITMKICPWWKNTGSRGRAYIWIKRMLDKKCVVIYSIRLCGLIKVFRVLGPNNYIRCVIIFCTFF